jgi:hypothetical protein
MHGASKLMMTFALIAGPMLAQAQGIADEQVIVDEEAGANATPLAAPPVINPRRTVTDAAGHSAHIFPTYSHAVAEAAADTGPLVYHGGPVMPQLNIYTIFWAPATLQNGSATSFGPGYMTVMNQLAQDYTGHTIDSNNTQYYQTINSVTTYVSGLNYSAARTSLAASYTDTSGYPSGGCSDSYVPTHSNCVNDTDLRNEITKVMGIKGWTGGLDKIYVIFTSAHEGSCFDSTNTDCAYVQYCAYHTDIGGTPPIVYANEPYGDPNVCLGPGTVPHSGNLAIDPATTAFSHEVSEAVTDPEPSSGWTTAAGSEIGDLCAYNYGTNSYDSGLANQDWNGHVYELQTEWDNHRNGCVQVGP